MENNLVEGAAETLQEGTLEVWNGEKSTVVIQSSILCLGYSRLGGVHEMPPQEI